MSRIRTLDASDAEDFAALLRILDAETEYLMFEPGERPVDLDALRVRLASRDPAGGVLYALVDDGRRAPPSASPGAPAERARDTAPNADPAPRLRDEVLTGFIGAQRRQGRRNRHALHLVIAIRQAHVGHGHGRALLAAVERFARHEGAIRLELSVMVDNERAIRLYESAGFEREGTRRQAVRLARGWQDEFAYAKLLDT